MAMRIRGLGVSEQGHGHSATDEPMLRSRCVHDACALRKYGRGAGVCWERKETKTWQSRNGR